MAAMMPSRFSRSATAPAKGPSRIEGRNSAVAISPRKNADSVSSQASAPTPVRCIQVPTSETALPVK